MTQTDYEIKPKKKFPIGWVIGGIAILLFGACGYAFFGMFKNIGVVRPINADFIAEVLNDQLPPVASGIYSEQGGFTDEAIAPINDFIKTIGAPDEIGAANCGATSNASTGGESGNFVNCAGTLTYPIGAASITTRWREEGEAWKLYHFNLNIADAEAYRKLVTDQALAQEKAEQKEQEAGEP